MSSWNEGNLVAAAIEFYICYIYILLYQNQVVQEFCSSTVVYGVCQKKRPNMCLEKRSGVQEISKPYVARAPNV